MMVAAGASRAATFYVDSGVGRDDPAWNGGPGAPWRTITYALSRATGANTFLCHGVFAEDVAFAYDDRGSSFVANPDARLNGDVTAADEAALTVQGFDVYGGIAGPAKGGVTATDCYFNDPAGAALGPARFYGAVTATGCVFENCRYAVHAVGPYEFGQIRLSNCTITDCVYGVCYSGGAYTQITGCTFTDVDNAAILCHDDGEGVFITGCRFTNCCGGLDLELSTDRGTAIVTACEADGCGRGITATAHADNDLGIQINGCRVDRSDGDGVVVHGKVVIRDTTVNYNAGRGVYIEAGAADLGTEQKPGGNTFAANGAGFDVYNKSSANVPAYGNHWDPQTEAEMAGHTWQDRDITRIYDRWDDAAAGYVVWGAPSLRAAPASLGEVKALFHGGPTPSRSSATHRAAGE